MKKVIDPDPTGQKSTDPTGSSSLHDYIIPFQSKFIVHLYDLNFQKCPLF